MRVVALVSGGKDSCYNMMQCIAAGHEIVALANLQPSVDSETDSYMYQTVGHDGIALYSEAMGLPLFRRIISGDAVVQDKEYSPAEGDEVEDLYCLLRDIKYEVDFDAVSVGAIFSDYQRIRVENVCTRLGCVSLAFLWRRDQAELLQEMIDCGINAILIKTASLGLDPNVHLGRSIADMQPHLIESKGKYGINVCGEGGEYETFTLDCPLFKQSIVLDECERVIHSDDAFAPVGYLKLKKMHLVKKPVSDFNSSVLCERMHMQCSLMKVFDDLRVKCAEEDAICKPKLPARVKTPLDYIMDLIECDKADCCDGHAELCKNHNRSSSDVQENYHLTKKMNELMLINNTNGDKDSGSPMEGHQPSPVEIKCPFRSTRETIPFPATPRTTTNVGGWFWAMGIQGKLSDRDEMTTDSSNHMKIALLSLQRVLEENGMKLSDLIGVVIYVSDMDNYAGYNKEYNKFFESRPPVRVCVEAPLPLDTPILLEGLAFLSQSHQRDVDIAVINSRQCMHVQGISHWAPANIGPYSQAIWVGDIIYVAGQIGLVPGSMTLVVGGARMECKLALRHINRIIKATDPKVELRDVVQGICYVTDAKFIEECRHEWEKRTNNAIVEYLVVPRLPRDANVEWQIWAHKHNTAFEYEETGCYVGSGIKVRIIRRWNYENRVAAIVCRASTSDSRPNATLGAQEMTELTDYALTKLLRENSDKSLDCSLRIFYRIGAVNPTLIFDTLDRQSSKYSVAYSVLPVCLLVQDNTLITFCGVRHH